MHTNVLETFSATVSRHRRTSDRKLKRPTIRVRASEGRPVSSRSARKHDLGASQHQIRDNALQVQRGRPEIQAKWRAQNNRRICSSLSTLLGLPSYVPAASCTPPNSPRCAAPRRHTDVDCVVANRRHYQRNQRSAIPLHRLVRNRLARCGSCAAGMGGSIC